MTIQIERTPEEQVEYDLMYQQFMDAQSVQGDPGAVHPFTRGTGALSETEAVSNLTDTAGAAWVWHTQTFKAVPVNRNMLPDQLRKKDTDVNSASYGKLLFTVYGPEDDRSPIKGMYPVKGDHKCLLHPNGEHRAYYDTLGLPVCSKSNIASPFQVDQHTLTKHPNSWKALEKMRLDAEKADDRKFQRELLDRATAGNAPVAPASEAPAWVGSTAGGHPIAVESDLEVVGNVTTTDDQGNTNTVTTVAKRHGPKSKRPKKMQTLTCEVCPEEFEGGTVLVVRNRLKKHMKEEHADG